MDNERPLGRWITMMPMFARRVAGRRRHIELPKPDLGVLREFKRPSLREWLASLSPRWRKATGYTALVLVVASAAWLAYNSAPLSIQSVDVRGNSVLSAERIRDVAAVDDDSLSRPDLEGARKRLLALPMIEDAQVERDWPLDVDIEVNERNVFAVWRAGGKEYVVAGDGVIVDAPRPTNGVVIVHTGAAGPFEPGDEVGSGAVSVAARLVMTSQQTLERKVVRLQYSESDGLTVWFAGKSERERLRVLFGHPADYDFKIAALYAILRRAREAQREVRSVDLRFGQKVAVQWG